MKEEAFDDYILGKKLRLLHFMHERLYSFVVFCGKGDFDLIVYKQDEYENGSVELNGTQNWSIDRRIKVHSKLYKLLKPANVHYGSNGQQLLIEEVWL